MAQVSLRDLPYAIQVTESPEGYHVKYKHLNVCIKHGAYVAFLKEMIEAEDEADFISLIKQHVS